MLMHGWGRWPQVRGERLPVREPADAAHAVAAHAPVIARGLGRSYGDSALAARVLDMRPYDWLIDFDADTGVLRCAAGVTLDDILTVFVPRGWFPPVTPGTRFVTVGGAIASDVHGKNHHRQGCFSNAVDAFEILLGDGSVVTCSRTQHADLFHATCGGMGLTGVVLQATLQLMRIPGARIDQVTRKARNLDHALEIFQDERDATYSVAWLDCVSTGARLGRALVTTGEHAAGDLSAPPAPPRLGMPFDAPGFLMNRHTIGAFNQLYYARQQAGRVHKTVHYTPFFYPLDGIRDWNRLYGRHGFTQYQCVIPRDKLDGLRVLLQRIAASGKGSFLAVLKELGPANTNPLSFPLAGYTLALDFKLDADLPALLDSLDDIVLAHGGRLYLAKDARMSAATFRRSYPAWGAFQAVRERYGALGRFASVQSHRLGLEARP